MVHSISLWSVVLVAVCSLMAAVESKEVVCYYGTWATYRQGNGKFATEDIDPFLCTQLNYAFFDIKPDGSISITDDYLALPSGLNAIGKFYELKQRNPALKTIAAIGGWNAGTANFKTVAANPQLRATFARNAVSFLQQHRFDGMDIDWEYPRPEDKSNFVLFLRELANAFAPYNYLLTIAVAASESAANEAYDISAISGIVNYINLMTYDMHGNYGVTRHQAPINQGPSSIDDSSYKQQLNVEAVVKYWLSRGAPASKLTLGIPLYGRTFRLSNPSFDGVGAPVSGVGSPGRYTQEAGSLGYNEICEAAFPRKYFDSAQIAAYASGNGEWVSYDSVDVVNQKCNVIAKYGLGGGMVWSIEQDDFRGICGPKFTLLSTLNRCVNNNGPAPATTTTRATAAPTTRAPTTTTKAAASGSGSFVCTRDGYFRDPYDCNKYYRCYSGYKYSFNCPTGLYFNEDYVTCDWPYNVRC
ncbi:chitinase-3-like protein 1 [Anopheles stephensi]|uniref:chitinase-3-like protein 1 n=1 Tax=Anopheles stephensi TaxID=30069 RepID=UPI0016588070|nr:chitinase-3-like protein 1 [Anopheles stephensi]